MKSVNYLAALLLLSGLSVTNAIAEQQQRGATLIDQGLDGTMRYYNVNCPSGKRTNLNYDFKSKVTCTHPVNSSEQVCKADWDKDEAAKEACK